MIIAKEDLLKPFPAKKQFKINYIFTYVVNFNFTRIESRTIG